jgi:hypothetical protein
MIRYLFIILLGSMTARRIVPLLEGCPPRFRRHAEEPSMTVSKTMDECSIARLALVGAIEGSVPSQEPRRSAST